LCSSKVVQSTRTDARQRSIFFSTVRAGFAIGWSMKGDTRGMHVVSTPAV
jgi:hypothetical protein